MNNQNQDRITVLTNGLIKSEIMAVAEKISIDPEIVHSLLAPKATVNESGAVTIDGKTPVDAVAELLKAKPFLANGDTTLEDPQADYRDAAAKGDVRRMLAARIKMNILPS